MPARTGRPWQRTKARIIRRDGGICHLCGQPGADSADHLVPYAHGGTDDPPNLRAVHHNTGPRCNRIRGARSVDETRTQLARTQGRDTDWDW